MNPIEAQAALDSMTAAQREFAWLAGQPEEVGKAWRDAMGWD